jgi:hypothetical protein
MPKKLMFKILLKLPTTTHPTLRRFGLSADKVKKLGKDRGRVMETLLSNATTIMWILVMLAVIMYLVIVFIFGEGD